MTLEEMTSGHFHSAALCSVRPVGLENTETRLTCLTWVVTHLLVLFLMMTLAEGPGL